MAENKCPNCLKEIKPEYNYCPFCSFDLKAKKKTDTKKSVSNDQFVKSTTIISNFQIAVIFVGIIVILGVVLFVSGVFDTGVEQNSMNMKSPTEIQQGGVDLHNIDKINELRDYVKHNPNDYEKLLELAHLLMDSGMLDEAIKNYDIYLAKFPKNPDVIIDKGVCLFDLKKYNEADSVMQSALKINPNHLIGNFNLGIVNLAQQNMVAAKGWFKKVIEIDPNSEYAQRAMELMSSH